MKTQCALVAILVSAVLSLQAGTIKFPTGQPNITRNAGQDLMFKIIGSGFAPGAAADFYLLNAKTWQRTYLTSGPIYNGGQDVLIPLWWNWGESATYLLRVESGSAVCSSPYTVRIRSAVIWPYGGSVYYHGRAGTVTWVVPQQMPIAADLLAVSLWPEGGGGVLYVSDGVEPEAGRLDFTVPDTFGTYRVVLEGYYIIPEWWDSEVDGDWPWESFAWAQSEKVSVR